MRFYYRSNNGNSKFYFIPEAITLEGENGSYILDLYGDSIDCYEKGFEGRFKGYVHLIMEDEDGEIIGSKELTNEEAYEYFKLAKEGYEVVVTVSPEFFKPEEYDEELFEKDFKEITNSEILFCFPEEEFEVKCRLEYY